MKPVSLQQITEWVDGALIQGRPDASIDSVSTDSREVEPGCLFVALKGDRLDAHKFLGQVGESGAGAMLLSALPAETETFEGGIVLVRDTQRAFQELARNYRRVIEGLRVIGVTGSNGKTSTKDFLGAVLSRGGGVNATQGNFNNHVGLPITVLRTEPDTGFGVWEMGMNHAGEIEVLAEIASPDAAVVTQIGTAHIEHLKTRDAIAEEKSQLPRAVPSSGYCAMPSTDDYFDYVADAVDCEMLPTGGERGLVRAEDLHHDSDGHPAFRLVSEWSNGEEVRLSVRGAHMVGNALLAAAVGLREGIAAAEVADALSGATLTGGRLEEKQVRDFLVLDDSYNANPDSMRAAIRTLAESEISGRRIAVLGFMGELGDHEASEHNSLGKFASEARIDALLTVGERAARITEGAEGVSVNRNFDSHEDAAGFLDGYLGAGDLVLFKGSRAADMGKVLELLH